MCVFTLYIGAVGDDMILGKLQQNYSTRQGIPFINYLQMRSRQKYNLNHHKFTWNCTKYTLTFTTIVLHCNKT